MNAQATSTHAAQAANAAAARLSAPLALRQADPQYWRDIAQRAWDGGNTRKALECWSEVRRLQPESVEALFQMGCCMALLDEPDRAGLIFDAVMHNSAATTDMRIRAERLLAMVEPEVDRRRSLM